MKIILISSKFPPEYSGSGLRAFNTYKRLQQKFGIEYCTLVSGVTEHGIREYEHDGIPVHLISRKYPKRRFEIPKNGKLTLWKRLVNQFYHARSYWAEAWPTWMWLNRNARDADLIHVFGNVPVTRFAITWTKMTKKPVLVELVNLSDNPHNYEPCCFSWIYGKGYPKQALIVAISPHLKLGVLRNGVTEARVWCRPNPVDEVKFRPNLSRKGEFRRKWTPFLDKDRIIVHVAKFMPLKNQIFLLSVLERLPTTYKLVLAGPIVNTGPLEERDRSYFQTLENRVKQSGLEKRVLIRTGFVEHPEEFFQLADVSVMPSTTEALGTPMLEALACGTPVVANRIEGVTDAWIHPGFNGDIGEFDPQWWADAIVKACAYSDDRRQEMSSDIIGRVSTERIDAKYYNLFKEMVGVL